MSPIFWILVGVALTLIVEIMGAAGLCAWIIAGLRPRESRKVPPPPRGGSGIR